MLSCVLPAAPQVGGIGTVPAGRVEYGVLKPAMDIVIAPVGLVVGVKSVEKHQETLQQVSIPSSACSSGQLSVLPGSWSYAGA